MNLIKKLEIYRLENGITEQKLADMLGVSFLTVNRWFNGKTKPSKLHEYQVLKLLKQGKK